MRRLLPLALLTALAACEAAPDRVDLIVRNGDVYDGAAVEPRRIDVAVHGDRIVALGDLATTPAAAVIDATGLVVAPGFIDVQSRAGTTLVADGVVAAHVRQGITTAVLGDLDSPAAWTTRTADVTALKPYGVTFDWAGVEEFFERLAGRGATMNVATFVPLALTDRREETVRSAMAQGALGIAFSHDGSLTSIDRGQLTALARAMAGQGALAMHFSGAAPDYERSLSATMEVAGATGARVVAYDPGFNDWLAYRTALSTQRQRFPAVSLLSTLTPDEQSPRDVAVALDHIGTFATQSRGRSSASPRNDVQPREDDALLTVLARYVREERVISLGDAIRRMTGGAAAGLGIDRRGLIREGYAADLVLFDPTTIAPAAGDTGGVVGMRHVIVNGVPVLDPAGLTGARPGQPVYGRGRQWARQTP